MTEKATQRDAEIRARMLTTARVRDESLRNGWVPATLLASARDDEGMPVDDDAHAERLISDLFEWGFLEEERNPHAGDSKREFRHRRFRMTQKAWRLYMEDIAPHQGIADRRLMA